MAKRYLRDQPMLLPPDMRDWLPPDHPVWLVITVVEDTWTRRRSMPGGGPARRGRRVMTRT
jgi:hypothetical protein